MRDYDHSRLHPIDDIIEEGRKALADPSVAAWLDAEIAAGKGSDPSIILYTSGTTGTSKGVVLTGERSIKAATDTVIFDKLNENDVALAYLPLAWVGDHYLNYAQGLVAGFCMACPENADTAMVDLREIGPSFYFAPPRTLELLLTRVMIRMEDAGFLKRKLFHYFIGVARRYGERILNGQPVPLTGRLLYWLGNILVYGPLKNVLGFSRVRVAYTAGEAIGPDLFNFYRSIGLNLKQLYGQTEAFLYVTAQPDGEIYSDTVGPACPNVDIRIADNGEVQFKSPGMFSGYFKDDAKTAEAMTPDGYVKTGDAGYFDEKTGHLKIIDRAKDVGKLNDGTLFPPKYIENKLKFYPNIREVVAYGDSQDFVAVMINIDLTAVGSWAERNNVVYASYQELAGHPLVYDMVEKHVAEVNRSLAEDKVMAGAQIKRFLILHKELDADDGELTRTQKVRRGFIADRYAPLVKALYDGSKEAAISTEVTFEDGRKGTINARVKIRDMKTEPVRRADGESGMRAPSGPDVAVGDVLLSVENVSLSFGGVNAVSDVSFDIRKGEIRAIIGPNGAGKTSMLNIINGFYQPQHGRITFKGETRSKMRPHDAAHGGIARTFQNVALFRGMTALDNIMAGRTLKMHRELLLAIAAFWARYGRGNRASSPGRGDHRLPQDPGNPPHPGRPAALRPAKARGARPCARHGAGFAAARRADGRHEHRRERGHVALRARRERPLRHHHRVDRARHGRGDGPVRPGGRARSRHQDRRRHARRNDEQSGRDRRLSRSGTLKNWRTEGTGCTFSTKSSSIPSCRWAARPTCWCRRCGRGWSRASFMR